MANRKSLHLVLNKLENQANAELQRYSETEFLYNIELGKINTIYYFYEAQEIGEFDTIFELDLKVSKAIQTITDCFRDSYIHPHIIGKLYILTEIKMMLDKRILKL